MGNWAIPGHFTAPENHNQVHCYSGGGNCVASARDHKEAHASALPQEKLFLLTSSGSLDACFLKPWPCLIATIGFMTILCAFTMLLRRQRVQGASMLATPLVR